MEFMCKLGMRTEADLHLPENFLSMTDPILFEDVNLVEH